MKGLSLTLLALAAWTASPAFAQTAPWKQYLGANTGGSFSTAVWRATTRSGYPRGSNVASMTSTIDPAKLDEVLGLDDWINLQDGYNYRQQSAVDTFFNAIRADRGAGWRTNCALMAQAMVDGQVRNAATGHKAYWELGNEIYADIAGQTIGAYVAASNLPYPHPNSPYDDNPTHARRANDRGIIGYQVEYQIALALEAILGVNATAPTGNKIRILTPASTGSSIQNGSPNGWTSALLDYVIIGYEVEKDANGNPFTNFSKPLASSLAGQRLGDLVEVVNVHYVIGSNGTTLNTVFHTWTGGTNHTTGVFHTEEGGINAAEGGRGGLSAMQNLARAMDVWLTRGLSPAEARLIYYASADGPVGTRGTDALTELHGFVPADSTVLTRKPGLLSSGAAVLEAYTFENADATKRVLFVLPANDTAVNVTSVVMQAGGWSWTDVAGAARVWSSVANAASTATVTRARDGSSYTISFPGVSFTQVNQQGLVIFLTGSSPSALQILTPPTLPFGAVNAAYSQTLAAAGGTTPYSWSVTAGALPAGVSLNGAGVLSGTPTAAGTFDFTTQVTDGASATVSRAFSLTINTVTALGFTTGATLPGGTVGVEYSRGISVTGGTSPYTQTVTGGALPPGLDLASYGLLTGTPTTAGTFAFTDTVTDAGGATASRDFSLTIGTTGPSIITTTSLPNGAVGAAYSQALAATGGTTPYTWSIFSGALPGGLTLSSAGVVSGTPTTAGAFSVAVQVEDAANATASKTLSLTIDASTVSITTTSPAPPCVAGYSYSVTLAATGGTAPYSWNVSAGSIPAGLALSGAGILSGTPAVTGTFEFTAQVTDSTNATATKTLAITCSATAPLAILYEGFPVGGVGNAYSQALWAHGGTPPYTWSLASGTLPAGLTLDGAGVLSGTPTTAATYTFAARVTDAAGAPKTTTYNLRIVTPGIGVDGELEHFADGSTGNTTFYISEAGEVIPAYVRKPTGPGPFPLVILIHGGGTSQSGTYSLGRLMNPPTGDFVAAGWAVYSMDFSTVSGNAVADVEWALAARAVETARRLPYVDARRVAMFGQSHGGILTCSAASKLDILCAVAGAPAAIDPIAAWRFTQSGGVISAALQGEVDRIAGLYGVPMATLAASPRAYGYFDITDEAPAVRYPLFLVSGLNDTRAPPPVMEDYGIALTAAGKHFETYYPADGPHGFVVSSPLIPETYEFATRAVTFIGKFLSLADSDTDGLPDGWELSRFDSLAQGPTDDPDGDGQNNLSEWRAGTHPLDSASVMRSSAMIVLDVASGTARYTTELSLANPDASDATVALRYTASLGDKRGSGTVSESVPAGGQVRFSDAISALRTRGLAIPEDGPQGGVLVVEAVGAGVIATARTTTPIAEPEGRAGVAYAGLGESERLTGAATVFGLRSTATDRSNLAILSTSDEPVEVRVTAFDGDTGATAVLEEALTLPAYGWFQIDGVLGRAGFGNGWVTVERTSSTGSFSAYGVVNDNVTNDGSFVPPVSASGASQGTITLPVLVEAGAFRSELVVANRGSSPARLVLGYVESLSPSGGTGGEVVLDVPAGRQLILPDALEALRSRGLAIGAKGTGSFAGALRASVSGVAAGEVFLGARTGSQAPSEGQFGVFTPGVSSGQTASTEASVYGLAADSLNRTNVAVLHAGGADSGPITVALQVHDGSSGGAAAGGALELTLSPGQWAQPPGFFEAAGVTNGYVRITRLAGTAPWVAYGVVNDGGKAGERTGDGAYVPAVVPAEPAGAAASRRAR